MHTLGVLISGFVIGVFAATLLKSVPPEQQQPQPQPQPTPPPSPPAEAGTGDGYDEPENWWQRGERPYGDPV